MKLILIEAIPLLLQAICQTVEAIPGNKITNYAVNLQNLEVIIQETNPDLLWLDAAIPEVLDGSIIKILNKQYPGLKILIFSLRKYGSRNSQVFQTGHQGIFT